MITSSNKVSIPATIKNNMLAALLSEIGVAMNFALDDRTDDKAFWKAKAEGAREAYGWLVNDTVAA